MIRTVQVYVIKKCTRKLFTVSRQQQQLQSKTVFAFEFISKEGRSDQTATKTTAIKKSLAAWKVTLCTRSFSSILPCLHVSHTSHTVISLVALWKVNGNWGQSWNNLNFEHSAWWQFRALPIGKQWHSQHRAAFPLILCGWLKNQTSEKWPLTRAKMEMFKLSSILNIWHHQCHGKFLSDLFLRNHVFCLFFPHQFGMVDDHEILRYPWASVTVAMEKKPVTEL